MRKFASLYVVAMLLGFCTHAQVRTISGRVSDDKGNALPFASITLKGSRSGVSADENGRFTIKAAKGDVLIITGLGIQRTESLVGNENSLEIKIVHDNESLSEVVVTTAFGIKKDQRTTPYSSQVIKSEVLNMVPQTSLNNALAGKVAGVQFRSQSGTKLNNQSFARIRGGLLLSGDVDPIYVVDGTIIGDSYDIDPTEVESVTVLKGANATALFGSRAINGAIVISTKKALTGKSTIDISQGVTFDKVGRLPHLQNSYGGGSSSDFIPYTYKDGDPTEWKALDGKVFPDYTDDASWGPAFNGQDYAPWYAWVPGTQYTGKTAKWVAQPNNIRDFWNTGVTSNTNVNFAKAGQGYNLRVNYTKQNQTGLIPDSRSDRNILSAVSNFELNSVVSGGIDITYNTQKIYGLQAFSDRYANQTSGNFGQWNHRDLDIKLMKSMRNLKTPINTLASWNWASNPDGYDASNPSGFWTGNYWYNFYSYLDNIDNIQRRNRLYGNAHVSFKLNDNFKITGTVRKDSYNEYSEASFKSILESSGSQTGFLASYSTGEFFHDETNYELIGSFNKTFFNDLGVNILAGSNVYTLIEKRNGANTNKGLIIPDYYAITNSKAQPSVTNNRGEAKINSVFASGDFEYKKFVSATWAVRKDWSSTLPLGNNGLFYPAAGVAFIPTEFTKKALPWLSFAKVYGSWGKKPLNLDIYATNLAYSIGQTQWNGNFLMEAPNNVPAANLRGALITSYEAGLETRFLKSRLGVTINYYNETAKDQPVQINVGATGGYRSKVINSATVDRHGLEFTIDGTVFSNKNFTWTVTKTLGWLMSNKVTKIVEGTDKIQPSGWAGSFGGNYATAYQKIGQDWGQLIGGGFTKNADGKPLIDPSTGLYVNGDPNYQWGSVVPKVTGGLQNLFTYKNFVLNLSVDYQFGGKFFSLTESWGMYSGLLDYTASSNDRGKNVRDAVANGGGVHVTGVSSTDGKTVIDRYVDGFTYFHQFFNAKIAEPFIHDLSFIKLREVSIGYNLPVKKWGLTSNWVRGITVSAVATSPWLIYSKTRNFDPSEISNVYGEDGQLPPVRSYGFNIKFAF